MKSRFAIALIGIAFVLPGQYNVGFAEMPPAVVVAQMKGGTITAVGKDEIQVNGYTYRIKEKAAVVDHEGQPLLIEEIRSNGLVKYVLKDGQIETMIVTNPQ